jgi:thiol-disulfide isomerase/thioredoxin
LELSVKTARPRFTRRSIIAAAPGLAFAGAWGNSALAQTDSDSGDLPDAADAMVKIMPTAAPHVVFTNAKGQKLNLSDFAGHTLLVNLWATWCGPCVAELPSFAALAPKLKTLGALVLPISIDMSGAGAVQPFYAAHGIRSLPILLDSVGANLQALNTDAIPLTIVINPAGQLVARMDGAANWNTPAILAFLKSLGGDGPTGNPDGFIPA